MPYFYLVKVGFDDFSWNSFLESSNFCYCSENDSLRTPVAVFQRLLLIVLVASDWLRG